MSTGVNFQKSGKPLFLFYNAQSTTFVSMFRLVSFVALFFSALWANARVSEEDTMQINQLLARASSFANLNPDSAIRYYEVAEKESVLLKYPEGVARAKLGQAEILLGQNINSSISVATQVLELCERNNLNDLQAFAEARLLLASAYEEQGRTDSSAYYYYLLGRQIESGININPSFAVGLYTKLAIFWLNLYYGSKGNMEYKKVLTSYVERARSSARNLADQKDAISSTFFLEGAYHYALAEYDSARYYYIEYLTQREELGLINWQRKASCYVNIAETYLDEGNGKDALKYLEKAKEIFKSPVAAPYSQYYDGFTDLKIAEAYRLQGEYIKCIELIENTLIKLAGVSDRLNMNTVNAYKVASLAYESIGNFGKALFYNKLFISAHDSLLKKDNLEMINGMEVRYRMVEKDKQLAESRLAVEAASNKVQTRNQLVAAAIVIIIFGATLFYFINRKNEHKHRMQRAEMDSMQRNLEIERLNATLTGEEMERNRIARELHDGVGGLLSAAKMNFELFGKKNPDTNRADLDDGLSLLQVAAVELRKTAHNLMPETLMHEGLLKAIQNYCASLSGKNSPVIQVQLLGDVVSFPPQFEFSVYRIVQELVHNMARHSGATEGLVELNFREDRGLSLTIEDNGVGLPPAFENNKAKDGIGLRNVRERLKAVNGVLDIRSIPGKGVGFYIDFDPITQNDPVTI